jgi:hypothetical protein
MKKQLSRQTKRSHPVSAKVQTNRRPKAGIRKRIGSTALANKSNGVRQASPAQAQREKPLRNANNALANKSNGVRQASPAQARREKPLRNANNALANKQQAARIDQAAPEKTSVARLEKRGLIRHEEAIAPMNGASRSFNRTWLDWSNATMAANLRTTEELMRCKSPIDLWAISSRFALKSWLNLLPLTRQAHLQK